jgi:hypothetical protein
MYTYNSKLFHVLYFLVIRYYIANIFKINHLVFNISFSVRVRRCEGTGHRQMIEDSLLRVIRQVRILSIG